MGDHDRSEENMGFRLIHAGNRSGLSVQDGDSGFSFIELLIVTAILLILASAVMPLSRVTAQRGREVELRRALREIRTAIDEHKDAVDLGLIGGATVQAGSQGYPASLEILVDGVEVLNDAGRGLGAAGLSGRAWFRSLEWRQCLRCLLTISGDRAGWDEL